MAARYRATLAYDGTAYQGFQRQAGDTPTVQLAVERALMAITGQLVTVLGAGRTDTGVHATGQVIAFDVEWKHDEAALLRALNTNLPADVALQDLVLAPPQFHPRFDARARLYRYRVLGVKQRQPLLRDRAWQLRGVHLDAAVLSQAARLLIGEHDFAAFGQPPQGENTIRTVYISEWRTQEEALGCLWTYTVEANAFLQHMVRRMVWLLVAVGRGNLTLDGFEAVFKSRNRANIRGIAPPGGLTLEMVRYNE
jgi:tRNA pseudouridine38-40 synthase